MLRSIRLRLILSHFSVIVLAMGLSGILLFSLLQNYFLKAAQESLLAQARLTAHVLFPGFEPASAIIESQSALANTFQQNQIGNLTVQTQNLPVAASDTPENNVAHLQDVSIQIGTQLNTRIRVLDSRGIVLVDSWQSDTGLTLSLDDLVIKALSGQLASEVKKSEDKTYMHLALPVTDQGDLAGIIYLSQPLGDIYTVLGDLRALWLYATSAAALLASGIGLFFSRAITIPLSNLTNAASVIAHGNFSQQVDARSNDELGRLAATFNDMTHRLRRARQNQIEFVANVSHELRTPLTAIKGMVETLRAGAVEDLAVRDNFLQTTEEETDRLIRLVNDLLTLSSVDAGTLNLRPTSADMIHLTQNAVARLSALAQQKNLTVQINVPPHPCLAWVEPDRITQVLLNLLDNAIKYSHPNSTIILCISASMGQEVRVEIRDEGIGIPEEDLPHIGERFYRTDKARSRAQGGSGLGLAIAQALVRAHDGELSLTSAEGAGTTAIITLPAS